MDVIVYKQGEDVLIKGMYPDDFKKLVRTLRNSEVPQLKALGDSMQEKAQTRNDLGGIA